jgi:hypothetical protein
MKESTLHAARVVSVIAATLMALACGTNVGAYPSRMQDRDD